MKIRLSLTLILVFSFVSSCIDNVPLAPLKTVTVKDFPNAVGSHWVYNVMDNLQPIDSNKPDPEIDTVDVYISRFAVDPLSGVEATVWEYAVNNSPIPARPVVIKRDTVFIYWNWANGDKIGLVFPFEYQDTWQTGGYLSGDQTTVIDTESVRIAGGTLHKAYVLENVNRTTIRTDKRTVTMWFVPDFGMVKMHFHEEHASSVGDTTWTLIQHNNPDF